MAAVSAGTVATRASWRTEDGKMHGVNVFMARVTAARRFTCHARCCVTPPRQRGGEGVAWELLEYREARTQDGGRCPVSCSHRSSQKWLHWRRAQTGRHRGVSGVRHPTWQQAGRFPTLPSASDCGGHARF